MNKVNIANYIIYDLANHFNETASSDIDRDIVNFVAESWHKKHYVSVSHDIKNHHNDRIRQKFMM